MATIAVIGAGLSGLNCSSKLSMNNKVIIFEKSRGCGGRMSNKRLGENQEFIFDHGAQYFTVRDSKFHEFVSDIESEGIVGEWKGKIAVLDDGNISDTHQPDLKRYVGMNGMNSLAKYLSKGLDIRFNTRISHIEKKSPEDKKWILKSESGEVFDGFDIVLVSAPAEQTLSLVKPISDSIASKVESARSAPTWCVLLGLSSPLLLDFDAAFVHNSSLSWISRENSKPNRPNHESWVLHASPQWSTEHLENSPEQVLQLLKDEFVKVTKKDIKDSVVVSFAHRWRFATVPQTIKETCLFDSDLGIGACGDWCGGPRVEGAFLSGLSLADKVNSYLSTKSKY